LRINKVDRACLILFFDISFLARIIQQTICDSGRTRNHFLYVLQIRCRSINLFTSNWQAMLVVQRYFLCVTAVGFWLFVLAPLTIDEYKSNASSRDSELQVEVSGLNLSRNKPGLESNRDMQVAHRFPEQGNWFLRWAESSSLICSQPTDSTAINSTILVQSFKIQMLQPDLKGRPTIGTKAPAAWRIQTKVQSHCLRYCYFYSIARRL